MKRSTGFETEISKKAEAVTWHPVAASPDLLSTIRMESAKAEVSVAAAMARLQVLGES